MGWLSLLCVSVALALDAFAVAVISGITLDRLTPRRVFRLAFHFGLFQAMMPLIGWGLGMSVHRWVAPVDHWVAFCLLAFVGGRMIAGAMRAKDGEEKLPTDPTSGLTLVMLSVATSIDALAVGLTLAMIGSRIFVPALVIGIVAAAFTTCGMVLGRRIGLRWGKRVEVLGGLILIAIGARIVVEHLAG